MTQPDADPQSPPDANTNPDFALRIERLGDDLPATAAAITSGDLGLSGAGRAGDLYRDMMRSEISESESERIWSSTLALARDLWDADHTDASALLIDRIADAASVPQVFAERVRTARGAVGDIDLIQRAEALFEAGDTDRALALVKDISADGPYSDYPAALAARVRKRRTTRRLSFASAGIGVAVLLAITGLSFHSIFVDRNIPGPPTLTQADRDAMRDALAEPSRILRDASAADEDTPPDPGAPADPATQQSQSDIAADGAPQARDPGVAAPRPPQADDRQPTDPARMPALDLATDPAADPEGTSAPAPDADATQDTPEAPGMDPEAAAVASERVYTCALGRKVALESIAFIEARETPSPDIAARLRPFIAQVDAACDSIDMTPEDLARVVEIIPETQTRPIVERLTGVDQDPASAAP